MLSSAKDVKNDIPKCSIHKYRNTDTQLTKRLLHGPLRFIYSLNFTHTLCANKAFRKWVRILNYLFVNLRNYFVGVVIINLLEKELGSKVNNFNSAENRESSEEAHRSSNQTQLGHQGYL